jgi:hypothetical protein
VEEFFTLRDENFLAERLWVIERHARERAWYEGRVQLPQ